MRITITGMKHHDVRDIADCLVPKNAVIVTRDPEWDKEADRTCDGLAYKCECKGVVIGYIPLVRTLRKYYNDATSETGRSRNKERGLATKAVRDQLRTEWESVGTDRWTVRITGLLYANEGKFIEYQEYSDLCQSKPEEAERWKLCEVSIEFDDVHAF